MSYEPTLSECVEGVRYCLEDDCGADNPWLCGQNPPDICRKCDAHLCCSWCGEVGVELDGRGKCEVCREPAVKRLVAVDAEFGLRLVERKESA